MKTVLKLTGVVFGLFGTALAQEDGFTSLFDGESLDGWSAARGTVDNPGGAFHVNRAERAIHAYAGEEAGSKQVTDCLVSDREFSHYILKLEYKWLENRFAPRTHWDRDAGLLFHVHGDLKKVWFAPILPQIL